jgi:multidrug efflux pump subunit AcrB
MNISAWSIRHPVPSLVLFLVLLVLGLTSFQSLPVTKFPNIDVPIVQARIYQSGRRAIGARNAGYEAG